MHNTAAVRQLGIRVYCKKDRENRTMDYGIAIVTTRKKQYKTQYSCIGVFTIYRNGKEKTYLSVIYTIVNNRNEKRAPARPFRFYQYLC